MQKGRETKREREERWTALGRVAILAKKKSAKGVQKMKGLKGFLAVLLAAGLLSGCGREIMAPGNSAVAVESQQETVSESAAELQGDPAAVTSVSEAAVPASQEEPREIPMSEAFNGQEDAVWYSVHPADPENAGIYLTYKGCFVNLQKLDPIPLASEAVNIPKILDQFHLYQRRIRPYIEDWMRLRDHVKVIGNNQMMEPNSMNARYFDAMNNLMETYANESFEDFLRHFSVSLQMHGTQHKRTPSEEGKARFNINYRSDYRVTYLLRQPPQFEKDQDKILDFAKMASHTGFDRDYTNEKMAQGPDRLFYYPPSFMGGASSGPSPAVYPYYRPISELTPEERQQFNLDSITPEGFKFVGYISNEGDLFARLVPLDFPHTYVLDPVTPEDRFFCPDPSKVETWDKKQGQ